MNLAEQKIREVFVEKSNDYRAQIKFILPILGDDEKRNSELLESVCLIWVGKFEYLPKDVRTKIPKETVQKHWGKGIKAFLEGILTELNGDPVHDLCIAGLVSLVFVDAALAQKA